MKQNLKNIQVTVNIKIYKNTILFYLIFYY